MLGTGALGPTGRGVLFHKENKRCQLYQSPWLIAATVQQFSHHHCH